MDKPIEGDPAAKAKADREKFEKVNKVEVSPILTKGSRGKRILVVPELKSPDEMNPKWIRDPEEVMAERKAKAKVKRSKDEA